VSSSAVPETTQSSDRPRSVREWAAWLARRVWLGPTLLTLALGLHNLGQPELWRDELRTWSATTRTLSQTIEMLGNTDAAVSLYYLFLHYWIEVFGDSAVSMRMPSVLAMTASAGLVALVGKRLFDARVGLIAGLLFAVVPNLSRFAQEARPYALTMLAAVGSTLLLLRALENRRWHRFVLYGITVGLLALLQPVAMPLLAVHAAALLLWWRRDRAALIWSGASALGGLVLAAPILYLSSRQYDHQVGSLPDPTIGELTKLPYRLFASGLVGGAVLILALIAFVRPSRAAIFAAAWAVIPIAAVWVVSHGDSYWMTRYMLPTLPGFVILAAAAIATFRLPMMVAMVMVVAGLGIQDQRALRGPNSHDIWNYPDASHQYFQYELAAQTIEENMRPGDGIVYSERWQVWLADLGLAYHMQGTAMPRDVFLERSAVDVGDFWAQECAVPASCLHNEQRIWIVSVDIDDEPTPWERMEPEKAAALKDSYTIVQRWEQGPDRGLTLTLVVRNDLA
jgi:mannosyltransferase